MKLVIVMAMAVVTLCLAGLFWVTSDARWRISHSEELLAAEATLHQSEEEVIKRLRKPTVKVEKADVINKTKPFPWPGYSVPPYSVEKTAYIYVTASRITYIFIGHDGKVKHVFSGRS